MPCEQCGEREAVVHLTQIAEDRVTVVHLCERCAAERGFDTGAAAAQTPLGGFLATLTGLAGEVPGPAEGVRCPGCGAGFDDFKGSGRLGCAECYVTFGAQLRDLVRRLHGAARHVGERYVAAGEASGGVAPSGEGSSDELQAQLRSAIAAENFEEAARLRDRLRGIGA